MGPKSIPHHMASHNEHIFWGVGGGAGIFEIGGKWLLALLKNQILKQHTLWAHTGFLVDTLAPKHMFFGVLGSFGLRLTRLNVSMLLGSFTTANADDMRRLSFFSSRQSSRAQCRLCWLEAFKFVWCI